MINTNNKNRGCDPARKIGGSVSFANMSNSLLLCYHSNKMYVSHPDLHDRKLKNSRRSGVYSP